MTDARTSTKNELEDQRETQAHHSTLTREELINELRLIGFKRCKTASAAWKATFFFENSSGTILILMRSREIDILKTNSKFVDLLTDEGRVRVYTQAEGTQFAEYHYSESQINIHKKVLEVAKASVSNSEIDPSVFCKVGITKQEWVKKHIGDKKKSYAPNSDLYDAISLGDGEDAYLGDGIWIRSGGSTYDGGR